ncbi:hypothetical protein [Phascolarctobacterium sp.]
MIIEKMKSILRRTAALDIIIVSVCNEKSGFIQAVVILGLGKSTEKVVKNVIDNLGGAENIGRYVKVHETNWDEFEVGVKHCSLAIIIADNTNCKTLECSEKIAKIFKDSGIYIAGIWIGEKDPDSARMEKNLESVDSVFDLIIPVDPCNFSKKQPKYFTLALVTTSLIQLLGNKRIIDLKKTINCLSETRFAYYAKTFYNKWDVQGAVDFAVFNLFFVCPFFVAKDIFLIVKHGSGFYSEKTKNGAGDDGIICSYIEDYIDREAKLHSVFQEIEGYGPFDISIEFLVTGFSKDCFIFDEDNAWQYPEVQDVHRANRINRKLSTPFKMLDKKIEYERHKKQIKRHRRPV